ncbi:unnamed protein product [Cochlearia groenlandica]
MANPEMMKEEMIMIIDIPGKQEAPPPPPVCVSESYCAEAVKTDDSVIVAKTAIDIGQQLLFYMSYKVVSI